MAQTPEKMQPGQQERHGEHEPNTNTITSLGLGAEKCEPEVRMKRDLSAPVIGGIVQ